MYNLGNQFKMDKDKLVVDSKCILMGEKYRIQVLNEGLIRFEYSEQGKFVDSATSLVVARKFERPIFSIKEDAVYLYIETKFLQVKYMKNAPFSERSLSAKIIFSQKEWYYSLKEVKNYGGTTISLDNQIKMPNLSKGLFNPDLFAVLDDSNSLLLDEFSNVYQREKNTKDIYLFAYNNDFSLVLENYYTLTGKPSFIPRYALGNWWSRDIPYHDEHIINLMNKFRMNNIPISVFLFDKDWSLKTSKLSKTSGFSFNQRLIKDPANLINFLHQINVKVGVKVNPKDGIFSHETYFSKAREYIPVNKKGYLDFNPFDAKFMDLYFKLFIHPLEKLGIDFFWNDYDNLENRNSLFILNDYMTKDIKRNGKRGLILGRNANFAPHRYPILYSGRNQISWEVLKFLPLYNITSANIGVSNWSHDIGGSVGGIEEAELYIRSVELGVFSPFLRFNTESGTYYKREPWRWDIVTNNIVSYYLRLRHQLIPYIYSEMYNYHKEGLPLIKPFYYEIPEVYDDPIYINQYYFGSSMLISPIVKQSDPLINRTIQKFYLPKGVWYDFKSGKKYIGNKKYVSFYKIEDYPVFIKAGGIIPTAGVNDLMSTDVPKELEIHVFPGKSNSYNLYEDDGITNDYLKGKYKITNIDYNYLSNNYTLIIRNIEGDPNIYGSKRNYKIRFRNTKQASDVKVYANDQPIPYKSYLMDSDFIIEVKDFQNSNQLMINCQGSDIEIDALMLINDDLDSILSDMEIPTKLKDNIASVLYDKDMPFNKKRIAIRKLKKKGLDKRSIKVFLRLIEYMSEV